MTRVSKKTIKVLTTKSIRKFLKPGDIINVKIGKPSSKKWYENIGLWIAYKLIILTQRSIFGKKSNYKDVHTMIYFDDKHILSVQPPYPLYVPLAHIKNNIVSVYRYTKHNMTNNDIEILRKASDDIINSNAKYDIGQLIDILFATENETPYSAKYKWFDYGKKNLVCSVSVGLTYEKWRLWYNKTHKKSLPQLFSKLNPNKWSKQFINKFYRNGSRWSIDRLSPANFANTHTHFNKEFKLIGIFDKLVKVDN